MKAGITHLAAALSAAALTLAITQLRAPAMDKTSAFRLKEPALISTPLGQPYYLLPSETVLYHQYALEEGPEIYALQMMVNGRLSMERLAPDESAPPLQLFAVETDDLKGLLADYPLSKEDLIRILKARQVTREELEQMVLEWVD